MNAEQLAEKLATVARSLADSASTAKIARALIAGRTGEIQVTPARSRREIELFCRWPATLYRGDPNYVQPITAQLADRLTPGRDPFWNNASRELFLARRDGELVGTIAAIVDPHRFAVKKDRVGHFGWFECIEDPRVASALFDAARAWLRAKGCEGIEGPYNPSVAEEHGIQVDGFDTRPAMMESHHKRYYADYAQRAGLEPGLEAYAWLVKAPEGGSKELAKIFPEKLTRAAARARSNKSVRVRTMDLARWDEEIRLAHDLFNRSLATVEGFVPMPWDTFRTICESFKPIVDPSLIKLVEVDGKAAGFALVLPDANEALQLANGRLDPVGLYRVWRKMKRLERACFKILVIDPAFRSRGLESLLIEDCTIAMLDKGYREADLSLTGEENVKINFILAGLGFTVYRRYRVYRGAL
ncbi:MAG: hypothetical protein JNK05_34325 [Myxococcales bacterium]|nr:hypothetical protein [Myxococcales bacterium]